MIISPGLSRVDHYAMAIIGNQQLLSALSDGMIKGGEIAPRQQNEDDFSMIARKVAGFARILAKKTLDETAPAADNSGSNGILPKDSKLIL